MKLAILSNVTVEVLAGMLREEHAVWMAPGFGAWMETALDVPKELKAFGPETIYILLDNRFEGARGWTAADVAEATESLKAAFPKVPVVVPDIAALAADFGEAFYEEKMWKLASMPFSLTGLREIRKLFSVKKVLCLDLDNTLWKGVVVEDGMDGVVPDTDFQQRVKAVKERGVVLAALSKNDDEVVDPMWDDARMTLVRKDFVAFEINWDLKAKNIVKVAEQLNLGLESFVFVDDNPAERAQMRALCPEVCTAAFPPDLDVYFPKRRVTAEDSARTALYQAETERKEFAAGLSAEDYLKGLEIRTDIHPIRENEIARVAQLSEKTNQFNVCTNRYSEEDIRRLAADPSYLLVTMHSADRFGDQGLVAFVLVNVGVDDRGQRIEDSGDRIVDGGGDVAVSAEAEIVDWVMSCRAMNRRIEFALQREVERLLRERGVTRLTARWRRTPKNSPVKNLFEEFGFDFVSVTADEKSYAKIL